jgi:hypothetical protein
MMFFVGNDGCYRNKIRECLPQSLKLLSAFPRRERITDLRLGDYDHLLEFVGWLRQQTEQNGKEISRRHGFNIFDTPGTFALSLDITVPAKKILPKLGYKKKKIKAHTDRDLQSLWASYTLDKELVYKFFLWSMGREQEVAHPAVSDLNFFDSAVPICPKPHPQLPSEIEAQPQTPTWVTARLGRGRSWKMYKFEQLSRVLLGILSQVKRVAMG